VTAVINGMQGVTNSQGILTFTLSPGTYTVNLSNGATKWTQTITVNNACATSTPNGCVTTITTTPPGGAGIPGFPVESIIAGIVGGVFALVLLRRRRRIR
jgi:hypothetical protein